MDILAESPDRFLLLPVRDERAWAFYQEAVACFWTAQELDLTHDRYSELQDSERTLLNNVLAFFAAADGIVGENLAANFIPQVQRLVIVFADVLVPKVGRLLLPLRAYFAAGDHLGGVRLQGLGGIGEDLQEYRGVL